MYIIILIILIITLYTIYIFDDTTINISDNITNISNNIFNTSNIINLKNINNNNNNFHKLFFSSYINDDEIEIIDIHKGSLTNQRIFNEQGGSSHYSKFYIDSNVSNNIINYNNNYASYVKLPATK
jgi:hypothetical protein